jgi:hypothetical protein
MSFANFVPSVWNATIMEELKRKRVFVGDCHNVYKGKITDAGDSITFLGLGDPTITEVAYKDRNKPLGDPEMIEDQSLKMDIRQIRTFNFLVGDIDKAVATADGLRQYATRAADRLADHQDRYVANIAKSKEMPRLVATPVIATVGSTSGNTMNVLDLIDLARQRLSEADVPNSTEVILTVPPRFYTLVKKVYRDLETDNSDIMASGKVGRYGGVTIKESNNCARSEDGLTDHIMIRTREAIGFADAITKTEPYRPEKLFADAIKGLSLFDAKILRPKQCFGIDVKYN